MEFNQIALGKRIEKFRKMRGMSQECLAEQVGRSRPFISYAENGKNTLSLESFVLLANALEVSTDVLLQDSLESGVSEIPIAFVELLADCSESEILTIYAVAETAKETMRRRK